MKMNKYKSIRKWKWENENEMHDNAYTDLSKLCIRPTVEYENKMHSRKF